MKYPFPPLVEQFFQVTKICYSQTMPMVWRILFSLSQLNESRGLEIGLTEVAACYQLRTHGSSRFVLQSRDGKKHMIPRLNHNDNDWKRQFFFVRRNSIPGGSYLPVRWVKKAKKFKELVEPSPDTEEKLRRLFEIPEKERASCSEVAVTEASFSSEFTASMSSVPPPSSGKFSLNEIKAKIMKKKESEKPEKPDEIVISNPLPVVATRPKGSAKKRKTPDSTTGLDNFEGLSVSEVKEKINSTLNLGYERILELMKEQEVELRELRETRANFKELLFEHQKLKDSHAQEIESLLAQAGEEKKKIVEEAQESAINSVYQAMSEMAKEAADHGFTLPHWDYLGLGESVKLKAKVVDPQETQVAPVDEGKSGGAGGECSKVAMSDDSENAKA